METNQAPDPRVPVYRKPLFWVILAAVSLGIAAAACFLIMPKKDKPQSLPSKTEATVWYDEWDNENGTPSEPQSITAPAFSSVTFRWKDESSGVSILAEENGKTRTLFTGMPVVNVYFADVTGDGKPELCATVYFGSGMVDSHIVVYDYANRQSYTLWTRGRFDYRLYTDDSALYVGKTAYNGDKQIDFGTLVMQDGVLYCRWQSEGSLTPLDRELHESELYGEWLVKKETDYDGNVLYTDTLDLWKEYDFREDGTVIYNETVPISSDYELAFGHPVTLPYEVYNDSVHIAGDDASGSFRLGFYDREERTLMLTYRTDTTVVYARLKRMDEGA